MITVYLVRLPKFPCCLFLDTKQLYPRSDHQVPTGKPKSESRLIPSTALPHAGVNSDTSKGNIYMHLLVSCV